MKETLKQLWIISAVGALSLVAGITGWAGTSTGYSPATTVDTRDGGAWTVRAWADTNGNNQYNPGEELAGAEVYFGRRQGNPTGLTTSNGTLVINEPICSDTIFIRKLITNQPAAKLPIEPETNRFMYTLWLDSDGGPTNAPLRSDSRPDNGTWIPYTLTAEDKAKMDAGQIVDIRLAHPIFEWHLVVATFVESADFHNKLCTAFTNASRYLFDVTDGQMKLGKITIYENVDALQRREVWRRADMWIQNYSPIIPNADVNGVRYSERTRMHFGTDVFGFAPDQGVYERGYHTSVVHEFGHYALDLYDEYLNGYDDNNVAWTTYRREHPDEAPVTYALMDSFGRRFSEMSSYKDYLEGYSAITNWGEVSRQIYMHDLANTNSPAFYPCWQWVEHNFQTNYAGIPVEIIVPPSNHYHGRAAFTSEARRSGPGQIPPPYALCEISSVAPGGAALKMAMATAPQSASGPVTIRTLREDVPVAGVQVIRWPAGQERINPLGITDRRGELRAYDVGEGDVLVARWQGAETRLVVGQMAASTPILIKLEGPGQKAINKSDSSGDGLLGVVPWAVATVSPTNRLALRLTTSSALAGLPSVVAHRDDGAGEPVNMLMESPVQFSGSLELGDSEGGTMEVACTNALGNWLTSADQFAVAEVTPAEGAEVYSRDGWVDLHLQPGTVASNSMAVIYAGYAPTIMPAGFTKAKVGPLLSLSVAGGAGLNGQSAALNVHYREADLVGIDETTIRLYQWNQATNIWEEVLGGISVDENVLSAMLTNLGVFAVFADSTEDVTPPGAITNLTAFNGTNGWNVNLSWTATGDDGNVGTATSYILKFSQNEITTNNWDSCGAMSVGFAPNAAGTVVEATLQMPDPGVTYYFAICAQDEAGNLGPMSNVATARSFQLDTDGDGMPDQWEYTYGLDPTNNADANLDLDTDGLSNRQECDLRTNPTAWDSDGDGMSDGWEHEYGLDPHSAADDILDPDNDGLNNLQEYRQGRNPLAYDTLRIGDCQVDGDGSLTMIATGEVGRIYTLEVSTNLVDWATEASVAFTNTSHVICDPSATNAPVRFYRLRQ